MIKVTKIPRVVEKVSIFLWGPPPIVRFSNQMELSDSKF